MTLGAFNMKSSSERGGSRWQKAAPVGRKEPLSDARFQDLLSKAGAFFADAERDVEGERLAVIAEIRETMQRYGLTVDDLA